MFSTNNFSNVYAGGDTPDISESEEEEYEEGRSQEFLIETEQHLLKNYKSLIDIFNKDMSPQTLLKLHEFALEMDGEGKGIISAFVAFYLELLFRDFAKCGNHNQRIMVSNYYKNMKLEFLQFWPQERIKETGRIMKAVQTYYYSTKTRGASFPKKCKNNFRK